MTPDASLGGLAADSRSLDSLRRAATANPAKAAHQVATQFEALFVQQVLKGMRDAGPKSALFDSEEQKTYREMLDQQLSQKIAAGGTGLAGVIERQIQRSLAVQEKK
jgi:flagellar protein FlgJ